MSIKTVILIFCTVLLSSCHPLFCDWDSGYEQLIEITSDSIVIGKYELSEESVKYLKSEGYNRPCLLELLASGNFNLQSAPDFMFDSFGENSGQSLNRKGEWGVYCGQSFKCMIELQGITVVPLMRKKDGTIGISITIGDGDECNGLVFERMNK
ncbi:MAG: hypothetical protein AB8B61_00915 [Cyclobacteriaceae bacterium]